MVLVKGPVPIPRRNDRSVGRLAHRAARIGRASPGWSLSPSAVSACLLALYFTAAVTAARAEEPPVVFARGGRRTAVPIGADWVEPGTKLVLTAFGRPWGEPARVEDGAAEFLAPAVRVPVVFRVVALDEPDAVLAECVVYPHRPRSFAVVPWMAAGAPRWFSTWCDALDLPLTKHRDLESFRAADQPIPGQRRLLVVGWDAAGLRPAALARLASERTVNVLVLADGARGAAADTGPITVLPKHAAGPLAGLRGQHWALPPSFPPRPSPFHERAICVVNRETWLAGPGWPLVEELRCPIEGAESRRVVVSYLPWQRQLGRLEVTDALFLRLLAEAAKGAAGRRRLDGQWRLLHPAAGSLDPRERPVLAAALGSLAPAEDGYVLQHGRDLPVRHPDKETAAGHPKMDRNVLSPSTPRPGAYVLDLRGDSPLPAGFFDGWAVRDLEAHPGRQPPLLILGDDPALDRWKWLAVDRTGEGKDRPVSPRCRPGVIWLHAAALPPSVETQLRVMQLFTDWNIALEEDHDLHNAS